MFSLRAISVFETLILFLILFRIHSLILFSAVSFMGVIAERKQHPNRDRGAKKLQNLQGPGGGEYSLYSDDRDDRRIF